MSGSNHLIVDKGDTVRWTVVFQNASATLANPTTLTYAQRKPNQAAGAGTTSTSGWTNPSTGTYYRDITFDLAGLWHAEARAEGNGVDQVERLIVDVRASKVG